MAHIVHAVAGKKIEDAPSIRGEQLRSDAPLIADVHLKHVEQSHPLPGSHSRHIAPTPRPGRARFERPCPFSIRPYGDTAIEVGVFPTEYEAMEVSPPVLASRLKD